MNFPQKKAKEKRAFWRKRQVFPADEFEVIKLFHILERRTGWEITYLSPNKFPDAIIEKNGHQLTAEFEYCAKNFVKHGHDPQGCDLIICWFNDWPDAPIPVWALIECGNHEAYYINEILRMHYVSRRTLVQIHSQMRELFRTARETLGLKIDDPEWGKPSLEQEFHWMIEALHNPPEGFRWALALAAASQGQINTYTFNWWLSSVSEIREDEIEQ